MHIDAGFIVEAEQFKPNDYPWPTSVVRWDDRYKPRDASWGYVTNPIFGQQHIHNDDWILHLPEKNIWVLANKVFQKFYIEQELWPLNHS